MDMNGKCLCGAVTFTATAVDPEVHACHCSMCRAWSGGPLLSVSVGSMRISGEADLARYASSPWAERGFCKRCGSSLFYRVTATDQYIVSMGAFEDPAPFTLASEIYVDEKPRGYDFAGEPSPADGGGVSSVPRSHPAARGLIAKVLLNQAPTRSRLTAAM